MENYSVFITDDRYRDPMLVLVMTGSESRAQQLAVRILHESRHYQAVELRRGGALIYRQIVAVGE